MSEQIHEGFRSFGFKLATASRNIPDLALIETYPHPALLSLMDSKTRVPYKVCKTRRYWPELDASNRLRKCTYVLAEIVKRLNRVFDGICLPSFKNPKTFAELKPIEDMVDALVCAWVGTLVLKQKAIALGDHDSAIWVPADTVPAEKSWSALTGGPFASSEFMKDVPDLPLQTRDF